MVEPCPARVCVGFGGQLLDAHHHHLQGVVELVAHGTGQFQDRQQLLLGQALRLGLLPLGDVHEVAQSGAFVVVLDGGRRLQDPLGVARLVRDAEGIGIPAPGFEHGDGVAPRLGAIGCLNEGQWIAADQFRLAVSGNAHEFRVNVHQPGVLDDIAADQGVADAAFERLVGPSAAGGVADETLDGDYLSPRVTDHAPAVLHDPDGTVVLQIAIVDLAAPLGGGQRVGQGIFDPFVVPGVNVPPNALGGKLLFAVFLTGEQGEEPPVEKGERPRFDVEPIDGVR
ncbi:hypothetical protein DESC_480034 [Desulfosarcina cetonica]|nr:hypothetical protein DESC_480034 [Desulfosarcina cetonica]